MKKIIIISLFLIFSLFNSISFAASILLQVDTLNQDYDTIRIHAANIPRDFVYSDPPVYAGPGIPVEGFTNLKNVLIEKLIPGQTYKFIAVLTKGTEHSSGSNIVQQKMPEIVIKLNAPKISLIEIKGE